MWALRMVMLGAAAVVLGGCAGGRTRQDMARLQSQVTLLDERIAQLERSSPGFSAAMPGEPSMDVAPAGTEFRESKKPKAPSKKSSGAASLKPSTREIQQALKNAGFYQGSLDGKMGPITREAIKEFQRVHGLKDDGVVGRQTWGKLKGYADLSAGSDELNAAEILK
jgi:peptidoglycan hydrolase-like protein with peptidoglycan-binding domain